MLSHFKILLALEIGFILMCLIESKLKTIWQKIAKLGNLASKEDQQLYNDLQSHEEIWSLFWFVGIMSYMTLVGVLLKVYLIIVAALIIRRVFVEYAIPLILKEDVKTIGGREIWARVAIRIFGKLGGWWELSTLMLILIAINVYQYF